MGRMREITCFVLSFSLALQDRAFCRRLSQHFEKTSWGHTAPKWLRAPLSAATS